MKNHQTKIKKKKYIFNYHIKFISVNYLYFLLKSIFNELTNNNNK
jgi:hypothetical protein